MIEPTLRADFAKSLKERINWLTHKRIYLKIKSRSIEILILLYIGIEY